MNLIDEKANIYAEAFTSPDDDLLNELAQFAGTHREAHMLSGRLQGQFLSQLSMMIKPGKILELGTFLGYSALCLAKGLQKGGVLHTVELRENDAETAKSFISRSAYKNQIIIHIGEALSIIEKLNENWDLVFLDADKINYINYYEAVLPSLKPGGWIIADNVLFHGEVLEDPVKGKNAKAIHAFNRHVAEDDRVEQVMLTIRDGLLLIHKK